MGDDTITVCLTDCNHDDVTYIDDETYITDTGGEYTFNVSPSQKYSTVGLSANLTWDYRENIDPDRVEEMCVQYPALRKVWNNFYAFYKMVDQDYKGNYEDNDDIHSIT